MQNKYPNNLILLALRTTAGETQMACAARLDVTVRTISNWETARPETLDERKMKRVYKAYNVTPQIAQTRTSDYLSDIRKEGRPHPEFSELPINAAPQTTKPHTTNFLKFCLGYPNQVIGFGPKGHAMTIHAELDRLMRTNDIPDHHCDALIRYINGKRAKKGESLI